LLVLDANFLLLNLLLLSTINYNHKIPNTFILLSAKTIALKQNETFACYKNSNTNYKDKNYLINSSQHLDMCFPCQYVSHPSSHQ
jgi:hypothetical protein